MRAATVLQAIVLVTCASVLGQNAPRVAIDPASGAGPVYLSTLDADTEANFAKLFQVPMYQEYRPFSVVLINNSGQKIVALQVEWTVRSGNRTGTFKCGTDSLKIGGSGSSSKGSWAASRPGEEQIVPLGSSYAAVDDMVAAAGERLLVSPGLFVREPTAKDRGAAGASASFPDLFRSAEAVSASIEGVVLEDGLVMGNSADSLVAALTASKAAVDAVASAVHAAEASGEDGTASLRRIAQAPPDREDPAVSREERALARRLMMSRDWKPQLEKVASTPLPNFHR